MEHILEKGEKIFNLAKTLSKSSKVNSYDDKKNKESWTLAHSFNDLEESFKTLMTVLFPKLMANSLHEDEINELLLDIGEEFRHIIYHIKDPNFYRYIFEND